MATQSITSMQRRGAAAAQAQRAGKAWSELPMAQRVISTLVVVGLLAGGWMFVQWQNAPTYGSLFSNLSAEDGGAVVEQLQAAGVPYTLTDGGSTILVPRDQVYELRLQMSASGLPAASDGGYSLLDEQGVTASQFQQEVAYQRAMEGELAKTVLAIDGVESAVVHLAIPQKDVFLEQDAAPTASVLVQTAAGRTLSKDQVVAVVNLVSSSIEGLQPEAVTVVDGSGTLLSSPDLATGGGANDLATEYESAMAANLQRVLDTVVGTGNGVATVSAQLDTDTTESTTERFVAEEGTPPLSETTNTETYNGAGGLNEAGVLGPDNIAVPNGALGGDSAYGSESRTVNNAVGKVTEFTVAAPGTVERLSVSVVVDAEAGGAIDLPALEQTLAAAAGLDPARGDVIQVGRMPFDATAAEAAAAELAAAEEVRAQAATQDLIRTAVLGGLILLALLVALVLGLRRRKRVDVVDLPPLDEEYGEYELQPEPAAVGPSPEQLALAAASAQSAQQQQLFNTQRDEVVELVERQPEEVAELLRSWLADRRS